MFEGIRDRLTLLPLGLNAEEPVISADGKTLLFAARSANQQSLYTYSLDELVEGAGGGATIDVNAGTQERLCVYAG